jgi:uncharacterized membrane protein YobD (UPF0266 family)
MYPENRWKDITEGDRIRLVDLGWIILLFIFIPLILLSELGFFFQYLYVKYGVRK